MQKFFLSKNLKDMLKLVNVILF